MLAIERNEQWLQRRYVGIKQDTTPDLVTQVA
jgi:hypothetical protein